MKYKYRIHTLIPDLMAEANRLDSEGYDLISVLWVPSHFYGVFKKRKKK